MKMNIIKIKQFRTKNNNFIKFLKLKTFIEIKKLYINKYLIDYRRNPRVYYILKCIENY